jgi:hypothetical protein
VAVSLYSDRYKFIGYRCCADRVADGQILPLRPNAQVDLRLWTKVGMNWSALVVGDSLAEQYFISLLCLAWATPNLTIRKVHNMPQAQDWVVEPLNVSISFIREDTRELKESLVQKIREANILVYNAWYHHTEGINNGNLARFVDRLVALRPPQLHTIIAEPSPRHFPNFSSVQPGTLYSAPAVSSIDEAACDQWRPPLRSGLQPSTAGATGAAGEDALEGSRLMQMLNRAIASSTGASVPGAMSAFTVPQMYFRGDAHIGRLPKRGKEGRDCMHWCVLPGVLDTVGACLLKAIQNRCPMCRSLPKI